MSQQEELHTAAATCRTVMNSGKTNYLEQGVFASCTGVCVCVYVAMQNAYLSVAPEPQTGILRIKEIKIKNHAMCI